MSSSTRYEHLRLILRLDSNEVFSLVVPRLLRKFIYIFFPVSMPVVSPESKLKDFIDYLEFRFLVGVIKKPLEF